MDITSIPLAAKQAPIVNPEDLPQAQVAQWMECIVTGAACVFNRPWGGVALRTIMSVPSPYRGLDMRAAVTAMQCAQSPEFQEKFGIKTTRTKCPALFHALKARMLGDMEKWPHAEELKQSTALTYAASAAVQWSKIMRGDTVGLLRPESVQYFGRAVPTPDRLEDPGAQVAISKALQHIQGQETEAQYRSDAGEGAGAGAEAGSGADWPIGEAITHAVWLDRLRLLLEEDRASVMKWLLDVQDMSSGSRRGSFRNNSVWDAVLPVQPACAHSITSYFSMNAPEKAELLRAHAGEGPPHFYE